MANLEVIGNRAASEVYALMDHSIVTAENDGAGIYLSIEVDGDDWLISGCPTLAAEDEHAKWYLSSGDGDFHAEHPTFEHNADAEQVKAWILEQAEVFKNRPKG